jgi:predicted Zn-ribbon and HTH transcriptional regulator
MIKETLTIEDLENALKIPSFEEELALSDLPHKITLGTNGSAHIATCKKCGVQFIVGPNEPSICPKSPHDPEDDIIFSDDPIDDSDEDQDDGMYFEPIKDNDYGIY